MYSIPPGVALPKSLSDIDAGFMTALLRRRGAIPPTTSVVSLEESDVGMTAGYFSAIKRIKCRFSDPAEPPKSVIAKTWPSFELIPKESIRAMFKKDISGYLVDSGDFFPRPRAYLAAYDASANAWALILEDADTFAVHKVHEQELTFDEVMRLVPRMVDTAVAWEGCDRGEKSAALDRMGVLHWASEENLALYRAIMPNGAKLVDKITSLENSTLIEGPTWNRTLGPGFAELFTNKIEAFYEGARTENGATCTVSHGDLRGDNLFLCDRSEEYPDGWLAIDFQLMFRGPVPSDLAYLMTSGSVLPTVFGSEAREAILRAFYERFMQKTRAYPNYTWDQFKFEFAMMSTVLFVYYVGFGAAIWQAGALANQQAARVELGGKGVTLADLSPEELRKRMWWTKSFTNFRVCFEALGIHRMLQGLPANKGAMAPWFELPAHLR